MNWKFFNNGEEHNIIFSGAPPAGKRLALRHNGENFYTPLVPAGAPNAYDLGFLYGKTVYAPIRYFDEPINMLNGRTLADIKTIFQSGLGSTYFKAGDYFDVTFPNEITLDSGSIPADSTWRAVCLGIDHNAELEGYNRGHFWFGRNSDNVEIAFYGKRMNSSQTNAGGWKACQMRSWLNSTFFDALPADLQAVISPCTKYTDNVGGTDMLPENVTATVDNIWIPSLFEVARTTSSSNPAEADFCQQYDYFKNNGTSARLRVRADGTSDVATWRLRSSKNDVVGFRIIHGTSGNIGYWGASAPFSFVPCFTIGGDSD